MKNRRHHRIRAWGFVLLLAAAGAGWMTAASTAAAAGPDNGFHFVPCDEVKHFPYYFGPGGEIHPNWQVDRIVRFNGDFFASRALTYSEINFRRFNGQYWEALPIAANISLVYDGELYAGGMNAIYRTIDGDHQQWEEVGTLTGPAVLDMIEFEGDLIVGGGFSAINGVPANAIARWDGEQWHAMGAGVDEVVRRFGVYDGQLIASGGFSASGGKQVSNIARWDGEEWQPLGDGIQGNWVFALQEYNGSLYVGGFFSSAGSVPGTARFARWDGNDWHAVIDISTNLVADMVTYGDALLVGGSFVSAGGDPDLKRLFVLRDIDGETHFSPVADFNPGVYGLSRIGDVVMISGNFSSVDGNPGIKRIATWRPSVSPLVEAPQHVQAAVGSEVVFTAQSAIGSHTPGWSYTWLRDGVPLAQSNNGNAFGYDTDTLTLTDITQADAAVYSVQVGNGCSASATGPAVLSVIPEPIVSDCTGDLNHDGVVNHVDIILLLSNWGDCPE